MTASPKYDEWLMGVPALLDEVAQSWGLTPGPAYPPSAAGHVVRVDVPDRTPVWTVAQTVAWSGGSDYWGVHIETVRRLLEEAA